MVSVLLGERRWILWSFGAYWGFQRYLDLFPRFGIWIVLYGCISFALRICMARVSREAVFSGICRRALEVGESPYPAGKGTSP